MGTREPKKTSRQSVHTIWQRNGGKQEHEKSAKEVVPFIKIMCYMVYLKQELNWHLVFADKIHIQTHHL